MGDVRGFLKVKRQAGLYRPVCERVQDYGDVCVRRSDEQSREQASRCMDCGTPFCHWACPVSNVIPEWNDLAFRGQWKKAYELLSVTNALPEVTGRVCPALCEYACVLGQNDDAVTIRENELGIIEHAFAAGLVAPRPPRRRSGKKVAVIGSGPAGLALAAALNASGHRVVVFERDERPGGLLRYGIPDFKLEKWVLDRRIAIWEKEGITFKTGVDVGGSYPVEKLKGFDAVCFALGSRTPRDLNIEGRQLEGVHFALEYLIQSNKRIAGAPVDAGLIDARGKRVVVIGGGDTGSDCIGTAHRQGASCVVQVELLPEPPTGRTKTMPWPKYPMLLKTTSSHQEGGERHWAVLTKKFSGEGGRLKKLCCCRVEFVRNESGASVMKELPGSAFEIEADLAILAMGFLHVEHSPLLKGLGVALDAKGNVASNQTYMTSVPGVFAAGDARRGQSLVVWALQEGRACASAVDAYLSGNVAKKK